MDVQQISQLLQYEPETGRLLWLVDRGGKARAGMHAGSVNGRGYRYVRVSYRIYAAHRLAWLLAHGDWPNGEVDHINGDKLDNRLANLRVVTRRQNTQNRREHREGRLVGCSFSRQKGRWHARIMNQGCAHSLGLYDTEQEAHEAYLHALQEMTK